jgi:hypothetical protein
MPHISDQVGYSENDTARGSVRTTIVVSLSGASVCTSWDFHDVVRRCALALSYSLNIGENWTRDKGDTVAGNGDADRIKDTINSLASSNGGDKRRLSLVVAGKSAGGVLAWNTFKRNFGSHIGAFHRVALVMVDPHGSVYDDDRRGTYCDDQDLWWPGNWSSDQNRFRVYHIYQQRDGLTGADFPDRRVYRKIRLAGSNVNHDNIIYHIRTRALITEALSFALSGE